MTDALILLAGVVLIPAAVGWIYGRNNVDPNTKQGRAYYASRKTEADQ